jgi:hypothetical protein
MKRAIVLAVLAVMALPGVASADSWIRVWEDAEYQGQYYQWTEPSNKSWLYNANQAIPPFDFFNKCNAGSIPVEGDNWNNCISSYRLTLENADCFAAYDNANYENELVRWDARSGARLIQPNTMSDNDKWSSIRWGHWSFQNQACYW